MKKLLIIYISLLILLTSCEKTSTPLTKEIIPHYFVEQITNYASYNPQNLHAYYYAYLEVNSYIYALNKVNHPHFLNSPNIYQTYTTDQLMLVNKQFYMPASKTPNHLVKLTGISHIQRKNEEMLIDSEVLTYLLKMELFAKQKNIDLVIFSAYRTYAKQQSLWKNRSSNDHLFLAKAGHSEHHTGLAIDISTKNTGLTKHFENTKVFVFLDQYAEQFGFILRYPKNKTQITGYAYEPWHYRYVGVEVATLIKENNLTLEEYIYQYTLLPLTFLA